MTRTTNGATARNLPPAAFAPVMATGIVSQGLAAAGAPRLSGALLAVAVALYAGLLAGLVWRVTRYPREVAADLCDTGRVFGFFTFVAGSDVLAARLAPGPWRAAAAALTLVAVPACTVLLGCVARVVRRIGADDGAGGAVRRAEGTWFLCVVGVQSAVLAVAGPTPGRGLPGTEVAWAAGLLLYAAVATLVARRLLRFGIRPRELSPPYWISMGACAISLLAGARLAHPGLDAALGPALTRDILLTLWAWATCLLPPLLAAGAWRHLWHRIPLAYEPTWWTIVFPTGMYAMSTIALGTAEALRPLVLLGHLGAWVALGVWSLSVAGLVHRHIPGGPQAR
ncbi:tellurite resistance/C4-dicarboxylate transporter family protein [Streptomyces sp. NPDC019937]|uniref:tellurite resistance/C4-dicarboxylate transporter family protein n=1 Tax=Streptomyces sp. NPDC019937 TaxID=3154787 RepID=UPI0033CA426A